MRRDLGFQVSQHLGEPKQLKQKIQEIARDPSKDDFLATTPLRLTITPYCNFNCRIPGAQQGWCVEEPGEFSYPKIRMSLLKK